MKYMNKVILYFVVIFSTKIFGFVLEKPSRIASRAFVESTQIASQAGIEATKTMSKATVDAAQKVGSDAAKIAADAGKEVIQTAVQAIVPIAQACIVFFAVKEVVHIGRELYAYTYPDAEKMTRIKNAEEKIAAIDAKRDFRDCLMKNAKSRRNNKGIPVNCEECGQAFAMKAGRDPFQEMVETFKEVYSAE